jgi:site-specific DNA-methyltransferase (adenine-specific)
MPTPAPVLDFTYARLPKNLQQQLLAVYDTGAARANRLADNAIHQGDARALLHAITPNSVALSVWSPPYFVGKSYEANWTFDDWQRLLHDVIDAHFQIIEPGGFLAVNIADILCFRDPDMPRISADNVTKKRSPITLEMVRAAVARYPRKSRNELAAFLGCSEQTIDRRLNGNNVRGGKYEPQTRLKVVGGLIEEWATKAGFYPYDRRVWVKDPCWENSKWASLSYRSVDEFEYIYFFWKPGITTVDRRRLSRQEWKDWGSRGVWSFPSVRTNDDHEAKFPYELPARAIRLLTDPGDLVLDCFMGSGTTAVAAAQLGRRYIGIELESRYVTLARRRVAACSLIQPTLPATSTASKVSRKPRSASSHKQS